MRQTQKSEKIFLKFLSTSLQYLISCVTYTHFLCELSEQCDRGVVHMMTFNQTNNSNDVSLTCFYGKDTLVWCDSKTYMSVLFSVSMHLLVLCSLTLAMYLIVGINAKMSNDNCLFLSMFSHNSGNKRLISLIGILHGVPFKFCFQSFCLSVDEARKHSFSLSIATNTHGSVHQGHQMFGTAAGKQCACVYLFAILYSALKTPSRWQTNDLDAIVLKGSLVYEEVDSVHAFLAADDLPSQILVENIVVPTPISIIDTLFTLELFPTAGYYSLQNSIETSCQASSGCILWIGSICVSVMPIVARNQTVFYLFDSHSRDNDGNHVSDGTSILLHFSSTMHLVDYLCRTFLSNHVPTVLVQIAYTKIVVPRNVSCAMLQSCRKRVNDIGINKTEKNKNKFKKCKIKQSEQEMSPKQLSSENESFNTNHKKSNETEILANFNAAVACGPVYICTVCHRKMYKASVIKLNRGKYPNRLDVFAGKQSFDSLEYICLTCCKHVRKNEIPCQAVVNKLELNFLPDELLMLNRLERVLVSRRVLFIKIFTVGCNRQKKARGAIINVPVSVSKVHSSLPLLPNDSEILMIRYKKRLEHSGYVFCENVRPSVVIKAIQKLRSINPLYSDVHINDRLDNSTYETYDNVTTVVNDGNISDDSECEDDHMYSDMDDEDKTLVTETCMQQVNPIEPDVLKPESSSNVLDIAPAENETPINLCVDENCEALAFPYLFPEGKNTFQEARDVKRSLSRYVNMRLLNYSNRFSANYDYIFYLLSLIEMTKIRSAISIAMKKLQTSSVTAGHLRNATDISNFRFNDQIFQFMHQIPGTPAYWKRFLYDILAMVRQLGIPQWFLTLSCNDLKWHDLMRILLRQRGLDLSDEKIDSLDHKTRCDLLNSDPVTVARHFQNRVELFFKLILDSNEKPLGIVKHYAIKVEFQMRGSPHVHILLWTDSPQVSPCPEFIEYLNKTISANIPDGVENEELREMVLKLQTHHHTQSCRKKHTVCRYGFPKYPTDFTIVATPVNKDLDDQTKKQLLEERERLLNQVKTALQKLENVNNSSLSVQNFLDNLGIKSTDCYKALSTSANSEFEIHLKRSVRSVNVNNYFRLGLLAHRANIDIQPITSVYGCVTYICSYIAKEETAVSQAMKQVAANLAHQDLSTREKLQKIGASFLTTRENSVQEAVYKLTNNLYLRKIKPGVVFINSSLPNDRVRTVKSKDVLDTLDDNDTNVFTSNMIERYQQRPDVEFRNGHYDVMDQLCLAEFCSFFTVKYNYNAVDLQENDYQPDHLSDMPSNDLLYLPSLSPLMGSKDFVKRRNTPLVIRFPSFDLKKNPEKFYHSELMLFFPWRKESDLVDTFGSYEAMYHNVDVQKVLSSKRSFFFKETNVNEMFADARTQQSLDYAAISPFVNQQQVDDEVAFVDENTTHQSEEAQPEHLQAMTLPVPQVLGWTKQELIESIRKLNCEQKEMFSVVLDWAKKTAQSQSTKPMKIFLTGGAGVGKTMLIRTIYNAVTKVLRKPGQDFFKPSVGLFGITGIAAHSLSNGATTLDAGLNMFKSSCKCLPACSSTKLAQLRNQWNELQLVIIDEVSMMSPERLAHLHQRLCAINGVCYTTAALFNNISVILVGDLYQLPPIGRKIFEKPSHEPFAIMDIISKSQFSVFELRKTMRQQNDTQFIGILNRVRKAMHTQEDVDLLTTRVTATSHEQFPHDALHIYPENKYVTQHNLAYLQQIEGEEITVMSSDRFPQSLSAETQLKLQQMSEQSKAGNLLKRFVFKVGCRVMLIKNIDIPDGLVNGALGTLVDIDNDLFGSPAKLYIKFDNPETGLSHLHRSNNPKEKRKKLVAVDKITAPVKITRFDNHSNLNITRNQFPFVLAHACTIHKVQSLTVNQLVFSTKHDFKQKLEYGQVYVALSRVKTLAGLFLEAFDDQQIRCDPQVTSELAKMKQLETSKTKQVEKNQVKIVFLNIQCLKSSQEDTQNDQNLGVCNVLALTETQYSQSDQDVAPGYQHVLSKNKYLSKAFKVRNCTCRVICAVEIGVQVKFDFPTFTLSSFVVYKPNLMRLEPFVSQLQERLEISSYDVIAGDFNIARNSSDFAKLENLLSAANFVQLVTVPTHIRGNGLDHCFVSKRIASTCSVETMCLYYSDHDAIVLSLTTNQNADLNKSNELCTSLVR